jgi:hypothetical protein
MKNSIWDILTGLILLGILCLLLGFGVVLFNPGLLGAAQPLSPAGEVVPTIFIPTETEAAPGLPPTWTPTPLNTAGPVSGVPTLRPSSTPMPTFTIVVLPTFTATKKVASSGGGTGVGGGSCNVVYQSPADSSIMEPGQGFTTRWTLKNISSKDWASDSVDIRVVGGDRMHTGSDLRDLPYTVAAGSMVDILIDMAAPDGKGTYTENWGLYQGGTSVCRFFVTIQVK